MRNQETRRNSSCSPFFLHFSLSMSSSLWRRRNQAWREEMRMSFKETGSAQRCQGERNSFECGTINAVKHVQATFTTVICHFGEFSIENSWLSSMICWSRHMLLNHTSDYSQPLNVNMEWCFMLNKKTKQPSNFIRYYFKFHMYWWVGCILMLISIFHALNTANMEAECSQPLPIS